MLSHQSKRKPAVKVKAIIAAKHLAAMRRQSFGPRLHGSCTAQAGLLAGIAHGDLFGVVKKANGSSLLCDPCFSDA